MRRLLIANRGEIAVRVARAAHAMGVEVVAVYSDADAGALHVEAADRSVHIGASEAALSYLDPAKILAAAAASGADAIHPGYGFLSENAAFARAVIDAGLVWIGPPADAIDAMGDKAEAKALMRDAGVPVLPGWEGESPTVADATAVGFPLLIKAVAGGGGRGMRVVQDADGFDEALASAQREAQGAFGSSVVLLERYVVGGRHVEVQVLGDGQRAVHVGERECSVQRRHQKVIEEAPSPAVDAALRERLGAAATAAAEAVKYVGAGTIEFLLEDDGSFWFLEMNTRLQVEHPVTEAVWGVDLVQWQIRLARGEALPDSFAGPCGHAIEARLYAEDPAAGFLPQSGRILAWTPPEGARVDTGVRAGDAVSPFYDPMIAKVITSGRDREEARQRLCVALDSSPVLGLKTNARFLGQVLEHPDFVVGDVDTGWLEREVSPTDTAPDAALVACAAVLCSWAPGAVPWSSRGLQEWHVGFEEPVRVQHRGGSIYGVGGTEVEVLDRHRLRVGGVVRRAHWILDGRTLHIAVDGLGQGVFAEADPLVREVPVIAGDGTIRAPMSGKVVRVDVSPGGSVAHGDSLVVLEAMKMETPVAADLDGVVSEVRVAVGDQVRQGDVLVLIDG
jgi:acetyl/propionyl-CoA carboxylase alpha subunit